MKQYLLNRTNSKISLLGLLILVFFTACSGLQPFSVSGTDFSASELFDYEIEVENQKSFRLSGINGSIDITGNTDLETVKIWGKRTVRSESIEDAEEHLDYLEVSITENSSEIYVKTVQPRKSHGRNYEVTYHVQIPESWEVIVENVNGNVEVYSVEENVSINLTNGDIRIEDISGNVSICLTNGNTRLREIFGNVYVGVTNGGITGKLTLADNGICQLSTVNGQIDLEIPINSSANFSAAITNGNISISDLVLTNLNMTRSSATGRLGDGKGSISLEVVNGQINVKGF